MLVEFTVGNYLSFKDKKALSMVASSIKEHETENVFSVKYHDAIRAKEIKLLKSASLYGANAGGKSNLIKAIGFMKNFILISSKETQVNEKIKVQNFAFSNKTLKEPTTFEIIFFLDGVRYRYGFEVDEIRIYNEWLFMAPKGQEAKLFIREKDNIDHSRLFKEGKGLRFKTRKNALFLSVCAQFNGEISTLILNWFKNNLKIINGIGDRTYDKFTLDRLENPKFKKKLLEFMSVADLGIEDIVLMNYDISDDRVPNEIKNHLKNYIAKKEKEGKPIQIKDVRQLVSFHPVYDNKKSIGSNFINFGAESEGTQKLFAMAGLIIATLKEGKVLVVDEFDSRLHPLITKFIIELFNSSEKNPCNAQLIFATHDTNALANKFFRRDQIWFVEKDRYGASDLYPLIDYKVRQDATYNKDYILGRYGAIPYIGEFITKDEEIECDG